MYIYNVTINVEESVLNEWLLWMEKHIQEVLDTGHFVSAKFTEVLVTEEMGGKTYSVQYAAKHKQDIENYYQQNAESLRVAAVQKFGDKMLAFRTELKLIKDYYPTRKEN